MILLILCYLCVFGFFFGIFYKLYDFNEEVEGFLILFGSMFWFIGVPIWLAVMLGLGIGRFLKWVF